MNKLFRNLIKFQNIAIIILIAIFFVSDLLLKSLALKSQLTAPKKLLGDVFLFNFTRNYQMAFSLPWEGTSLLISTTLVVLLIFYLIIKNIYQTKKITLPTILLTIILFGAISNLLDRYRYGFVVDYLELKNFTVFNLADAMISISALFFLIYTLKINEHNTKKENY